MTIQEVSLAYSAQHEYNENVIQTGNNNNNKFIQAMQLLRLWIRTEELQNRYNQYNADEKSLRVVVCVFIYIIDRMTGFSVGHFFNQTHNINFFFAGLL